MPRVGCRQCSKRRITCDEGRPTCRKCAVKGLECSGYGFQYRFVENKRTEKKVGAARVTIKHEPPIENRATPGVAAEEFDEEITRPGFQSSGSDLGVSTPDQRLAISLGSPTEDLKLELIRPGVSNLLSYFSTAIAPAWGLNETGRNDYRDILLPLAFNDDLVQRAVCTVSSFHLCISNDQPYEIAEVGRSAVISQLTANLSSSNIERIFNTSTWATLLVLLVCETVTGSADFPYLYKMILDLLQDGNVLMQSRSDVCRFLLQQTRMFQLFTPPLLDADTGVKELQGSLDRYLEFMGSPEDVEPALSPVIALYRYSYSLARDIYVLDAEPIRQTAAINAKLAELRALTAEISVDTPGMHALVWAYFIAGASSCAEEERKYFVGKLRQVYRKTRMKNILVALQRLEEIWAAFPHGGWARHVKRFQPVLAI